MRLFRLLPLMLFLLLCGCQGGDSAAGSLPDLDKAQEVRVIPAGETAPTQVLTEKSQIEALILAMDLDHWSTADLPRACVPPEPSPSLSSQPKQYGRRKPGTSSGALSDPALPGRPLPDLDRPGSLP